MAKETKITKGLTPELVETFDELKKNLATVEEYLRHNAYDQHFQTMAGYIGRGHNFVAYRVGDSLHFAPSKFIGYKDNNLKFHERLLEANVISGTRTDGRLSTCRLFGYEHYEDDDLEYEYRNFCQELNVDPGRRTRKFWLLEENMDEEFISKNKFLEGRMKLDVHNDRERNPRVVIEAKRLFKEKHERLYCEICGFDFEKTYGIRGVDYIQAHHNIPVSLRDEVEYEITPEDFTMVCPNCHAMLHKAIDGELPTVAELQKEMKKKSK